MIYSAAASKKTNTFSLLYSASCFECEEPNPPTMKQVTVIYGAQRVGDLYYRCQTIKVSIRMYCKI